MPIENGRLAVSRCLVVLLILWRYRPDRPFHIRHRINTSGLAVGADVRLQPEKSQARAHPEPRVRCP